MAQLIEQDDQNFINMLKRNPDIPLFFIPSPLLREMVAKNEHPYIQALGPVHKKFILDGVGIKMETQTIIDYLEKTLDARNSFLLENGTIQVHNTDLKYKKGKNNK